MRQSKQPAQKPYLIRCPLFIGADGKAISCKPIIPGSSRTTLSFASAAELEDQQHIFCCENYSHCEYYLSYQHFLWKD